MNIYNEFKNIENRLSGKEPTIHGGTYCFAVDRLDKSDDIILSLKDYFLKLEAVNEWIVSITDITDYAEKLNGLRLAGESIDNLLPKEEVYLIK